MAKQIDVLIIGQGISGTFLSWELQRAGLSYLVIDELRPFAASRIASGLINPVTGRRLVTTWMIDELMTFAREAYGQLGGALRGDALGGGALRGGALQGGTLRGSFLERATVVDFFPTVQMRLAFQQRMEEDASYLQWPVDERSWDPCFHYELGYGMISPCYWVDMQGLLAAARTWMGGRGVLREERFERGELEVEDGGVRYRDIEARRVIFCDGIESFESPFFSRLPFAPNKGEALIVEIPGLGDRVEDIWEVKAGEGIGARAGEGIGVGAGEGTGNGERGGKVVFKRGVSLVPWQEGLYWVGSSYEWAFEKAGPTEVFRKRMEQALKEWVRLPFRVVEHVASVRPATIERRPFVGFHPVYPAVGILNGMGTKGCSLAPYFARQLAEHITQGAAIRPDADILRFTKVLSRR